MTTYSTTEEAIATQHRELARLSRDAVDPLAGGRLAASCRGAAACYDKLAELFDPPDPPSETETPELTTTPGDRLDDRVALKAAASHLAPTYDRLAAHLDGMRERMDAETPEPAELGKLLKKLISAAKSLQWRICNAETKGRSSVNQREAVVETTRHAIVAFVARLQQHAEKLISDAQRAAANEQFYRAELETLRSNCAAQSCEKHERLTRENHDLREAAKKSSCVVREEVRPKFHLDPEDETSEDAPAPDREPEPAQTPQVTGSEPERQPGDVWCGLTSDPTTLTSRPCEERAHRERPARQKTNTHPGWRKGVIQNCEQCTEIQVEPGEIPDDVTSAEGETCEQSEAGVPSLSQGMWVCLHNAGIDMKEPGEQPGAENLIDAIRELEANQRPKPGKRPVRVEGDRAMSPELTALFGLVERPGIGIYRENCDRLASAIIELEARQLSPLRPLGTSIQAAIDALPVTLRADATNMAEVATAAGEPVLGLRLLVSVKAEVIDPTATCRECNWFPAREGEYCPQMLQPGPKATACMKIQRKPEPEPKARFFRCHLELWVYPAGDNIGWWLNRSSKEIERSETPLDESIELLDGVNEISDAEALAILTEADWPEGVAKLREMVGKANQ